MDATTDTTDTTKESKDSKDLKGKIIDLAEGASSERLEAILALLSLDDIRAASYGEALSLIEESEFNTGTLKLAIAKVKDEQGLCVVRTRTTTRIFKFYKDEDNPDAGLMYRGFYVKMTTPEQKLAISAYAAERIKLLLGSVSEDDMRQNPAKLLDTFKGEAFQTFLTEPNKAIRKIVRFNMVEVDIGSDGVIEKEEPFKIMSASGPIIDFDDISEFIFLQLEEDLNLLMEQQGVIAKNSQVTDMFGV